MHIVKCKIADFNIKFETDIKSFPETMENYLSDFGEEDVKIKVSNDDISIKKIKMKEEFAVRRETAHKLSALHRKIGDWLPSKNAFVLHSACFDVDGTGVAFAALSGTGKTTHMNLWQQLLGDKMTIVNGDKPIVRFFDDEPQIPYAYGTPWNGKEHLGCNMRTKLRHICFIERSATNYVEKIDNKEAVDRIMKQVYMPENSQAMLKTIELINRLFGCCNLWIIHCNMEPEAAEVAYNTIINGKTE